MPAIKTYVVTEVRTITVRTAEGVEAAIAEGAKALRGETTEQYDEVQVQSLCAEMRQI